MSFALRLIRNAVIVVAGLVFVVGILVGGIGGSLGASILPSESVVPAASVLVSADLSSEELSSIPVEAATIAQIITAQVIDWDKLRMRDHVRRRHREEHVDCAAEIFKYLGGSEGWLSDRPVLPENSPKFPSFAIARNLAQALRQLGPRANACLKMTPEVIRMEFGTDYAQNDLIAVAVFVHDVDPYSGAERNYFVTMYFVPKQRFDMWRCDWHLTNKVYPTTGYFPC